MCASVRDSLKNITNRTDPKLLSGSLYMCVCVCVCPKNVLGLIKIKQN